MGDMISANAVELTVKDGVATIEQSATLTRLHYFDGKFLRADALTLEQDYHRALVRLSNIAGGWGVVHGLGIAVAGGNLQVTPGLAITPAGSTVLLSSEIAVEIAKLVSLAQPAPDNAANAPTGAAFADCQPASATPPVVETAGTTYYEITVGPVEALCGNEEVYGKLCADACVSDSQRPYWREGLVLRLRPIALVLPGASSVQLSGAHLRNRVASAYFAAEPWLSAPAISKAGLASGIWCQPAELYGRDEVPIGLLVRENGTTRFVDAWSARRERMDSQARGYWQGRMMMRPWNVYLAQILQFQCQLAGLFQPGGPVGTPDDECGRLRQLLDDSIRHIESARQKYAAASLKLVDLIGGGNAAAGADAKSQLDASYKQLEQLGRKFTDVQSTLTPFTPNRLLLNGGFVQLPPAGYLPVLPGPNAVNEQLERMFGEGVRLFFCTARADYLAHALEEDQHMERISLTRGLDDPKQIEDVQIYVPDGQIIGETNAVEGAQWFADLRIGLMSMAELFTESLGVTSTRGTPEQQNLAGLRGFSGRLRQALEKNLASGAPAAGGGMSLGRYEMQRRSLTGIARTAPVDGGGASFTLACWPAQAEVAMLELDMTQNFRDGANMAADLRTSDERRIALELREIAQEYLDLVITQDPFARQTGAQVPISIELRVAEPLRDGNGNLNGEIEGTAIEGDGKLTLNSRFNVAAGVEGASATARLHATAIRRTVSASGTVQQEIDTVDLQFPLFLMQRRGDAKKGTFMIAPAVTAKVPLAWAAEWGPNAQGTLREAQFGVFGTTSVYTQSSYTHGPVSGFTLPSLDIKPLAELRETAPLAPEAPARLQALNTLADIADATDDAAFLARARSRLLPAVQNQSGAVLVRATRDWVMFRRRRHADCDQRCAAPPAVSVEAFQAWHLKLDTPSQLPDLVAAFDKGDAEALKKFDFKRVDLLHYEQDSSAPRELASNILADWTAVAPGPQIVLGRVWEDAPLAGQGWQNRARLKNLITTLAPLVAMPASDVLKAMQSIPPGFNDGTSDGGMLLVTSNAPAPSVLRQQVFVLPIGVRDQFESMVKTDSPDLLSALNKDPLASGSVQFDRASGAPVQADLDAIAAKYRDLKPIEQVAYALVGKSSADKALALPEHQIICRALPAPPSNGVEEVSITDFGNGSFAATVVLVQLSTAVLSTNDNNANRIGERIDRTAAPGAAATAGDKAAAEIAATPAKPAQRARPAAKKK